MTCCFLNTKRKLLKMEVQNFADSSLGENGADGKIMSFSALLYDGISY